MEDECFNDVANATLLKVRDLLWQAGKAHPDIPYSVVVALIAESSLLMTEPDSWTNELMVAALECRAMKMQCLMHERIGVTCH